MLDANSLAYIFAIGVVLQLFIVRVCLRTPALRPWLGVISIAAILWGSMVVAKDLYFNQVLPPADAADHEEAARYVADRLAYGSVRSAMAYFRPGNDGYRFLLGVVYSITDAPELATYAWNGALGFYGLLTLLEVACLLEGCVQVPTWLVLIPFFSFSPMFWTTSNLKEGPVLFGICLTLKFLSLSHMTRPSATMLTASVGLIITGFFRPHIAIGWILSIGLGQAISRRRIGLALVSLLAAGGGTVVLYLLVPEIVQSFGQDGLADTMEQQYSVRSDIGNSAIQYSRGVPIPLVSGLILLLARPLPHEASNLGFLMMGAEVWLTSGITLVTWLRCRERLAVLSTPLGVTMLIALLIFGLQFTYTYNMGLLVRQRLQVFPAMLMLAALPVLHRQSNRATAQTSQPLDFAQRRFDSRSGLSGPKVAGRPVNHTTSRVPTHF